MDYNYRDIVDGINNGTINRVDFLVREYPHYQKCSIYRVIDTFPSGKNIVLIVVDPTEDHSERVSFWKVFKEEYKIFNMGRKGKFTLKQLWNNIEILNIQHDSL